jgi:sRNA-binding carbon storage regulator CsrA
MLSLTRYLTHGDDERHIDLHLEDGRVITVSLARVDTRSGAVRLVIDAPRSIRITRRELTRTVWQEASDAPVG